MSSETRKQLEAWIAGIGIEAGRILDCGGSQLPIKSRMPRAVKVSPEIFILDLPQPHETKQKPDIEWDLNVPIIDILRAYKNYFDAAFAIEISEYLYDPLTAFKNINYFLKPGGVLFVSFHFIYPEHEPIESDYLRYTPHGAVKLLQTAGFTIIGNTARKTANSRLLSAFYGVDGMRASHYTDFSVIGSLITAKKGE